MFFQKEWAELLILQLIKCFSFNKLYVNNLKQKYENFRNNWYWNKQIIYLYVLGLRKEIKLYYNVFIKYNLT